VKARGGERLGERNVKVQSGGNGQSGLFLGQAIFSGVLIV
jgi:hypothetical protein